MKKFIIAFALCSPVLAHAHGVAGAGASFLQGVWHPILGLDHMLALIAGGIWLGCMPWSQRAGLLAAFATITLTAGILFGLIGLPPQEWAVVATLVVLPVFLVVSRRWYNALGAILMALAAGVHASVHGAELALLTHGIGEVASAMGGTVCGSLGVLAVVSLVSQWLLSAESRLSDRNA